MTLLLASCGTTPPTDTTSTPTNSAQSDTSSVDLSETDTSTTTDDTSSTPEEDPTMYIPVEYDTTLIKYPEIPEDKLPRDYAYSVRIIQGNNVIDLPVYDPIVASDYFTRSINNWDMNRRYAEFAFTGDPVTIEVTVHSDFDRYTIMPSSKKIPSKINGNVITYTITEPCTTVVKINNDKDSHLTIFAEAPETERPDKNDENVIYFEAGYHEIEGGVIKLTSNQTLYLEPGALVKARVTATGENIKICGRGAFTESNPKRGDWGGTSYFCTLSNVTNGTVEGVRFLEAHCFNLVTWKGGNLLFDNVKLLCNQVSTDGLSVFGGVDGLTMRNCYFNVSDNVFVIGSGDGDVNNLLVEDCIVITSYAFLYPQHSLSGDPIVFRNIDVLNYGTFLKHQYPRELGYDKDVQLILENCTAVDSEQTLSVFTITHGRDGIKNFVFKNVSLPAFKSETSLYINTHDSEKNYTGDDITNTTITFDNVWVGGKLLTKEEVATRDTLDYSEEKNNKVIFTDINDKSAVVTERNDVILDSKVFVPAVYVGDRRIECKYQPVVSGNTASVSAYEILDVLGFENIKYANKKLTFSYGTKTYELAVEDEKAMVDTKTLSAAIKTGIDIQGTKVRIENIQRGDNLLRDPDFEAGLTMNWVTRNFTKFELSNEAQSGNNAIRIGAYSWGSDGGIYQDVDDIIRQYGNGTYKITAWVKKASAECDSTYIRIGIATDWSVSKYAQIDLTDEWQQIEFTYKHTTGTSHKGINLVIGQCNGTTRDVLVDNVSMTWVE